jgi:CrcB protein
MQQILLVGAGGFLGAVCRYLVSKYAPAAGGFPLGTLIVNVSGSFLLGVIMYSILQEARWATEELRAFVAVGFIGAFTTMSALAYETVRLGELHDYVLMGLNLAGNIVLCLVAVWLGRQAVMLFS